MGCGHDFLIVEDEPDIRDLMAGWLRSRGYSVMTAVNGVEALGQLDRSDFDVVISDLFLPGVDGIGILKSVKAACPETEVIIVTAHLGIENAVACVRAGAFDLLPKPFARESLLGTVEKALEQRRVRITAALFDACQEMLSTNSEQPLVERICATSMRLLGADDITLMLGDRGRKLRVAHVEGEPVLPAEARLGLAACIIEDPRSAPAIIPDALADDPRFAGIEIDTWLGSGLLYPIVHDGQILAIANLNRIDTSRRFRRTDLEVAGVVLGQAGLALRHEQLARNLAVSERLAAVGQVAGSVVHEINNPLSYAAAFLRLARAHVASLPASDEMGELTEMLSYVDEGVSRLCEISEDVRRLGGGEHEHDRFDLSEAIRSAIRIAGPATRASAVISTDLGTGLDVEGSCGRLSQVFLNLLVNAAQAVESTGRTDGQISVRSRRIGDMITIYVTDDGPGMAPDVLLRIAEPFFTTKVAGKGTGLGLAISRDIVGQHGGSLEVTSTVGLGTTFAVSLPAAIARPEAP